MKKLCLLLILILALICVPAFAAGTGGQGDMVARNGELSAFVDGNGYIYVSGVSTPVNATKASGIVSIDAYRILFFTEDSSGQRNLVSLKLDGFSETVVTGDAYAACLYEDTVYYISRADRTKLCAYSLDNGSTSTVFTASEALERVYASTNGVICTLQDGAGAYIQDAVRGDFAPYGGDIAQRIDTYDDFEVYLTDSNSLYMQKFNSLTSTLVDSSVQDWAVIGNTIYYLTGNSAALTLKSFDVNNVLWKTILQPTNMYPQLTASNGKLFMLSQSNQVFTVDTATGNLQSFASLPSLQSYAVSNGKQLDSYRIEAVSGQLNIYGVLTETNALPTFTFVDSTSQYVADSSSRLVLLSAYKIQDEETVSDLLQPAAQYSTLRRGSRGDAVSAIQEPLHDLGYYDYYIDGIFGWRTERAVELAQAELGYAVTGTANEALQRDILSGKLPAYDPYRGLSMGDRGLRVSEMQQRLRDLGYLADDADAIFGVRTEAAVELFQAENGLEQTGVADSKTLRKLYSDSAASCSSYIDLRKGDSGYRVRELNKRLKQLYYLEGEVGSSYNSRTVEALRRFQEETGLKQTGIATAAVQKKLFARSAPEYSGYITLQRGDDNDRVEEMQDRLEALGYPIERTDGYFDRQTKEMVRYFQYLAGLKQTGVADPDTLELLFSYSAPKYYVPEEIGDPEIVLSAYTRFKDGLYEISDSDAVDGCINVSWFASGPVDSYDIRITDDEGAVYADSKRTQMTAISVPLLKLDADRRYTIAVTAHSKDSKVTGDTYTDVDFVRRISVEPDPGEVGKINSLIITPTGSDIERIDGVYAIAGDPLTFSWSADGSVQGYKYAVTDADNNTVLANESADSTMSASLPLSSLDSNKVYTLTVSAVPVNGTLEHPNTVTESIQFRVKPVAEPTAEPTTEPTAEPTAEPTTEPTAEPAAEPATEPSDAPASEATPTPVPMTLEAPVLNVGPSTATEARDGIETFILENSAVSLSWHSDSAEGYNVKITDEEGNVKVDQNLTNENASLPEGALTPGVTYELTVTAFANDSQNAPSTSCYFELPAAEVTEAPVDEPVVEEPTVDEPVDEPAAEEPTVDEPVDEPAVEEPVVDEPVDEPAVEEPVVDEPVDEPANFWDSAIDASSDSSVIAALQQRLIDWGWLKANDCSNGKLDSATVDAVISFQNYLNDNGAAVEVTNADKPRIGTDTLKHLSDNANPAYFPG